MTSRARARAGENQLRLDLDGAVHPWVAKARAIDATFGGSELDAETLARFVRIVRVATGGATRGGSGRTPCAPAGQEAPRRAG